jgi:hypothetical protein
MAKRIVWTEQAKAGIRGIEQPLLCRSSKRWHASAHDGEGNTKWRRSRPAA